MASKYKIDIADDAYQDLEKIARDILSVSLSQDSADKWINIILSKIYDLDMFPKRNVNTVNASGVTLWHVNVKHKYVVYYEILETERIVRIWHILSRNMDTKKRLR